MAKDINEEIKVKELTLDEENKTAEDQKAKKGRGRPKKITVDNEKINEGVEHVSMSSKSNILTESNILTDSGIPSKTQQLNAIKNGVGEVVSVEKYSLQDVQERWKEVFRDFGHTSFKTISAEWGNVIASSTAQINNPFIQNARIKQNLTSPSKKDKDELAEALVDPQNHEDTLRSMSLAMYYNNYVYQTLIRTDRDTPTYCYYATPMYLDKASTDKNKFNKDSKRIDQALKKLDVNLTFKTISTQVAIEGKATYLMRTSYDSDDVKFFTAQKLNSDIIKLTSFESNQKFGASFNMAIFLQPGYDISQYPDYIKNVWEEMNKNGVIVVDQKTKKKSINPKAKLPIGHMIEYLDSTFYYWVKLPAGLAWTFYQDGAHPNVFPATIGMLEDFRSIDDYRWLQSNLLARGVTSILTGEIPLVKDPKIGGDSTAISVDTVLGYTDLFNSSVSENILPFFSPFTDMELHSIDSQPEALDVIYDRVRDLIATSGLSGILTISDKPSISSVKTAQMLYESKADYLTRQYQDCLNYILNHYFDLTYKWNLNIWGGIFNIREDQKNLKELVLNGATGMLPKLLSAHGRTLEDYRGDSIYLDMLGIELEDKDYQEANPVGRPKVNSDEIESDATGASQDNGTDVSDIKEFEEE